MTFDGRLANIRAAIVHVLYCASSQNLIKKALHEITVNSEASLLPFLLSLVLQ